MMKNTLKKPLAALLALLFALGMTVCAAAAPAGCKSLYDLTGSYFSDLVDASGLQVGSTGGEWIVIGLARSGRMSDKQIDAYYETAAKFVKENANENEQLHRAKSTENARLILALTAIGKDVTNVDGHNLLAGLSDQKYLEKQGINGPIYALIALDSLGYDIPAVPASGVQASRESILGSILDAQQESGGWSLDGLRGDPDMTAMAIQALAPYYGKNEQVKKAIDRALDTLSAMQSGDGSFVSAGFFGGVANTESIAQVIVALTALGIDPHTDGRFVKNGHSALDALCAFAAEGGGFRHTMDGGRDGMASEQGYYALTAYFRFLEGKTSLYDMSDLLPGDDPTDRDAARRVEELISQIGTPENWDKTAVKAARAAYDALTDGQKALVNNYALLLEAEKALGTPAQDDTDADPADKTAAEEVERLISQIGTPENWDEAAIKAARAAYDALTGKQKALVSNYSLLLEAEAALGMPTPAPSPDSTPSPEPVPSPDGGETPAPRPAPEGSGQNGASSRPGGENSGSGNSVGGNSVSGTGQTGQTGAPAQTPKTGDGFRPVLCFGLMALSLAGFVLTAKGRKRS